MCLLVYIHSERSWVPPTFACYHHFCYTYGQAGYHFMYILPTAWSIIILPMLGQWASYNYACIYTYVYNMHITLPVPTQQLRWPRCHLKQQPWSCWWLWCLQCRSRGNRVFHSPASCETPQPHLQWYEDRSSATHKTYVCTYVHWSIN